MTTYEDTEAWVDEDGTVHGGKPDPTPLRKPQALAAFPVEALPKWARDWVTAVSTATQTPPDLAGCCALGALSTAGGGRAVVEARPGWREPVNLYLLPVMPPGSRKSAVVAAATGVLYTTEKTLAENAKADIVEAKATRDIAVKAATKAQQDAAHATKDKRDELIKEAVGLAQAADELKVPAPPRLIADDVTTEAIGSLMAENGGRMAIISAEGGIFETMAGRYSSGIPNLDIWLKGHSGDQVRVDRKGRDSEYVPSPALTVLLTVQPVVLSAIARHGQFRGRGLTARFLYSLPPDNVGRRKVGSPPAPHQVAAEYHKRVAELVEEMAAWEDPAVLTLDDDAHKALLDFERETEPKLARDGDLGAIREWASKLVGAVVRIAGLLHLAGRDSALRHPIDAATVRAAIQVGEYFADHAAAAFDLLGDGGTSDALYVLEFLRKRQMDDFTIRNLMVALPRGRFGDKDTVAAAVAVLEEHGWVEQLEQEPRTGPGRKPSPAYRCHPSVLDVDVPLTGDEVDTQSTQYTEPDPRGHSVDSVDSVGTTTPEGPTGSVDSVDSVAIEPCSGCEIARLAGADACADCFQAGRVQ